MPKYPFIETSGHPELEDKLSSGLEEYRENFKKIEFPGELEKSEREVALINRTLAWVKAERTEAGVEGELDLDERSFHFVNSDTFATLGSNPDIVTANADLARGKIRINKEAFEGSSVMHQAGVLVHEEVHLAGYNKYHVSAEPGSEQLDLRVYRSGVSVKRDVDRDMYFEGLNEAITTFITLKIIQNERRELIEKFGASPQEFEEAYGVYDAYTSVLGEIAHQMEGENLLSVLNKLEQVYFTGNMMFLRIIERKFGPGSLRILASMGREGEMEFVQSGKYEKIMDFFQSTDQAHKDELAKELLSENDFAIYRLRQRKNLD